MHSLMQVEEARSIWDTIDKMPIGQVVTTLLHYQCCISGSVQVLKERLFRVQLKIQFPHELDVPFFDCYDLGSSDKTLLLEVFAFPGEEEERNINVVSGGVWESDSDVEVTPGSLRDLGMLGTPDQSQGNVRGESSASPSGFQTNNDGFPPPSPPLMQIPQI